MTQPLLTPREVAARLRLSYSTVCGMLRRGELPSIVVREGRGVVRTRRIHRVRPEDLAEWERKHLTGGGRGRR